MAIERALLLQNLHFPSSLCEPIACFRSRSLFRQSDLLAIRNGAYVRLYYQAYAAISTTSIYMKILLLNDACSETFECACSLLNGARTSYTKRC
jgi:hypothetical protein